MDLLWTIENLIMAEVSFSFQFNSSAHELYTFITVLPSSSTTGGSVGGGGSSSSSSSPPRCRFVVVPLSIFGD